MLTRVAVGLSTIVRGGNTFLMSRGSFSEWTLGVVEILAGVVVLIGFLTPIASICVALGNVAIGITCLGVSDGNARQTALVVTYLIVMSIVLALVGPGAFSVDARMFGRREITIPIASPPQGS